MWLDFWSRSNWDFLTLVDLPAFPPHSRSTLDLLSYSRAETSLHLPRHVSVMTLQPFVSPFPGVSDMTDERRTSRGCAPPLARHKGKGLQPPDDRSIHQFTLPASDRPDSSIRGSGGCRRRSPPQRNGGAVGAFDKRPGGGCGGVEVSGRRKEIDFSCFEQDLKLCVLTAHLFAPPP